MDFIQWWFEEHYILSLIITPLLTAIYSAYKGWYVWLGLSISIKFIYTYEKES